MTPATRARVQELVEQWRESAAICRRSAHHTGDYREAESGALLACAGELAACLAAEGLREGETLSQEPSWTFTEYQGTSKVVIVGREEVMAILAACLASLALIPQEPTP
jgi:hypothetical protein